MASFDLTREPWIPAVPHHGPLRDVSLREALEHAHQFTEIRTDSPLETLALYRLLQALFLTLFGNETMEEAHWHATREAGAFSDEQKRRIENYFDRYAERFDLLHPDRPFYQHPRPLASSPSPIAKLFGAEASGNNPTLFDHALDDDAKPRSLAEAARGLVATQATALGGGRSKPFYYSDAPLVAGAVFWLRGDSLFDALLLNSPPDELSRIDPDEYDMPAWEREHLPVPEEIQPRAEEGYLDYLTWQSRLLHLETETNETGATVATAVWMSQGDKLDSAERDPLMAYRYNEKTGEYPLKLRKDKALWRDAYVFYSLYEPKKGGAPPVLSWVADMLHGQNGGVLEWNADVFGLVNDQAKIELWQHVQMPIFPDILADKKRWNAVRDAIERTELQAKNLRRACFTCAASLLYPTKDLGSLGTQARDEARALAESIFYTKHRNAHFWASLEGPFYEWLSALAGSATPTEHEYLLAKWSKKLHRMALDAYDEATASLDTSARHIRARAFGRSEIRAPFAYASILKAMEEPA